jgi:hypothetical protein
MKSFRHDFLTLKTKYMLLSIVCLLCGLFIGFYAGIFHCLGIMNKNNKPKDDCDKAVEEVKKIINQYHNLP